MADLVAFERGVLDALTPLTRRQLAASLRTLLAGSRPLTELKSGCGAACPPVADPSLVWCRSPTARGEALALSNPRLAELAAEFGIATEFWDWKGRLTEISDETVIAVLAAMEIDTSTPEFAEGGGAGAAAAPGAARCRRAR